MFTRTERGTDMYKCRDCGEYFDEPKIYYEKYEFWGTPVAEAFYVCPCCEGSDFDEDWIVEEEEDAEEDS